MANVRAKAKAANGNGQGARAVPVTAAAVSAGVLLARLEGSELTEELARAEVLIETRLAAVQEAYAMHYFPPEVRAALRTAFQAGYEAGARAQAG